MKKRIYFTLFFFFFVMHGCTNQKQNPKEQIEHNRRIDSIAMAEKRSIAIADSIKKVMIKEKSLIAWGDAKFGMTMKEVLSTNAFKGSYHYGGETIYMKYENKKIAKTKISISDFTASFKMNELYRIDIKTLEETANYIDDLQADADLIAYQFQKKYGEPTYSINKKISIFDFNEGDEFLYKKWIIGSKTIYMQFGEVYSGSEYYYRIAILNSDFPTKEDPEEIALKKRKKQEQEEKEKYQF